MKVAIIGAGASGLVSLKYALEDGHTCHVYEQSGEIGGTWVFTELTDLDEYGLPVHSAMYKDLITNLPKETIMFENFPYVNIERSYIRQEDVLNYLKLYAKKYQLEKHIRFRKYIVRVEPIETNRWKVTSLDAKTSVEELDTYDAVFVCNGHYRDLNIPEIDGKNVFEGLQLHSHKYRSPEIFKNRTVLIIGSSSSGQDICTKISGDAKHIFITEIIKKIVVIPENVTEKCRNVIQLTAKSAIFEDGSVEYIDAIIYCTGYNYSFPFLINECGIVAQGKRVFPLYKHVVNVEKPTMFFIGIPFMTIIFPMLDLQVRFSLSLLKNARLRPTRKEMLQDIDDKQKEMTELDIPDKYFHRLGNAEGVEKYFGELSEAAKIQNLPPVYVRIYDHVIHSERSLDLQYTIVDHETFTVCKMKRI